MIFDSHHPKDYLAIRMLAKKCEENGIRIIWTIHDKDVMVQLMREHGLDPIVLAKSREGLIRKLGELVIYDWRLLGIARHYRPLALVGKTVSLTHVGWLLNIPTILINDDSAAANPQYKYLACPFASRIVTAECLGEDYGPRQRTYSGLMELAYLHPRVFEPDPDIRRELGVASQEKLFLIRKAAFSAYHDVGGRGLSDQLLDEVIERLEAHGRVFIVSEEPLAGRCSTYKLPTAPSRLHHVIAACDLVVGDGLTVCVEAALLGVPAIAFGSYIGKHSYSEVIEKQFGLMFGYTPDREREFLGRIDALLGQPDIRTEWARRRENMLKVWDDPTDVYWEELAKCIAPSVTGGEA